MSAKIHVKGITCIGHSSGRRAVVFGDIVEGEAKKGMSLFIPLNSSLSMKSKVESVEFIDIEVGGEFYVALVLKIEESAEDELDFYKGLNFTGEILEIRYE